MSQLLPSIETNPATPPVGSVIWLHGLGADGNDFAPIVPELNLPNNLPLRFVFPHAPTMPVTINNGYSMPAWYDIVSFEVDRHADTAGIEASKKHVHALIENEEKLGIPAEKIIIAGFSQGAVMALTTGLTYPKRLGGIIALSGYLPQRDTVLEQASKVNHTIPIFLGHGKEDNVVPWALGDITHQWLQKNHYSVNWFSYLMGHTVCAEEILDIAAWLKRVYLC